MVWQPRMSSSAERIYSEVEYITSNDDNYLDFDLRVQYESEWPGRGPSTRGPSTRSLSVDGAAEVSHFDFSMTACYLVEAWRVAPLQ